MKTYIILIILLLPIIISTHGSEKPKEELQRFDFSDQRLLQFTFQEAADGITRDITSNFYHLWKKEKDRGDRLEKDVKYLKEQIKAIQTFLPSREINSITSETRLNLSEDIQIAP
jgi:hypothetical protein